MINRRKQTFFVEFSKRVFLRIALLCSVSVLLLLACLEGPKLREGGEGIDFEQNLLKSIQQVPRLE